MAANVLVNATSDTRGALTQQQLEQLAKMMNFAKGSKTEKEIDAHFSTMISSNSVVSSINTWIIDQVLQIT